MAGRSWLVLLALVILFSCESLAPENSVKPHADAAGTPSREGWRGMSSGLGWVVFHAPLARKHGGGRRCAQRGTRGLCGQADGGIETEKKGDDLKPTTINWLMEKTKGRAAQFDVILETCKDRMELQSKISELKNKQAQFLRRREASHSLTDEVERLRKLGSQLEMAPEVDTGKLSHVMMELSISEQALAKSLERESELAMEEALLSAESIRLELRQQRARQLLKLHALVSASDQCVAERNVQEKAEKMIVELSQPPSAAKTYLSEVLSLQGATLDTVCAGIDGVHDMSVDEHLKPLVGAIKSFGGTVPPKKLGQMALAWPQMLAVSAVRVEQVSAYLTDHLEMTKKDAFSLIEHHPQILGDGFEANLQGAVSVLTSRADLALGQVGSIFHAQSRIALLDKTHVEGVVDILSGEDVKINGAALGKLLAAWPRLLLLAPRESLAPKIAFLRSDVGLSPAKLAKVVVSYPQLLTTPLESSLRKTFQWLLDLGVPRSKVERVVHSHPKALGYKVDGKLLELEVFLLEELDIERERAGVLISKFPQILGLSVEDNLRPTVGFLVEEVGVPRELIGKIAASFPQLMGLSVEVTLRPHLSFLRDELGIPAERLGKVIASFPHLLAYCLETNLRPTLDFLHNDIGVPRKRLGKLVANHPQILGYSVHSKLKPTVIYLTDEVGVPHTRIPLLVERCPKLLGCSVSKNLRPTVSFFRDELKLDSDKISNIVTKYPALLGLSIDKNLRPKLEYLTEELGIPRDDLEEMVGTCPQLLAYSLEKRIKPRHRLLEGRGLKLGLHSMLAPSDLTFYARYGEGLSSMKEVVPEVVRDRESGSYYWHRSAAIPVQPKVKPRKTRKPRATKVAMTARRAAAAEASAVADAKGNKVA